MNQTFKGKGTPEWTLTEEGITYKKKVYPFSQITDVTVFAVPKRGLLGTNGVLQVFIEGTKVPLSLGYSFEEKEAGEEAFKFIKEHTEQHANEDAKEIRMKCNVCGHIFCYSGLDLKKNIQHMKDAQRSALLSVGQALFTNQISSQMSSNDAQRHMDKVVDYSHCPNCHSANLVEITEEEAKNATANQNAPASSAMDELKKLKELLDMGIVTQEEFDAKKKQLLGL